MAIRKIRIYGDEILRQKAEELDAITPEIKELIRDMIDTMKEAPGVGLAAPQVGVSVRLIIVSFNLDTDRQEIKTFINPEIIWHGTGRESCEEGCLSVPDYVGDVSRWKEIRIRALDEFGNPLELCVDGLSARVIQHEIDHLDGVMFVDKLPPLKRDIVKRKLKKKIKREMQSV
jgi:peptide deformylase